MRNCNDQGIARSETLSNEKLSALIELYKMIRDEAVLNIKNYYQIVSFFGALLTILASASFIAEKYFKTLFLFMPSLVVTTIALFTRTSLTTNHIRFFLKFLEHQINNELGFRVFVWEDEYVGLHYGKNRLFYTPLLVVFGCVIAMPLLFFYGYMIYRIFQVYTNFSRSIYVLILLVFYILAPFLILVLYYFGKRNQNKKYSDWLAKKKSELDADPVQRDGAAHSSFDSGS
jgi:magnesium-transporting ATPase (P-type)